MITVHHLENSRSTAILFLLEELGLEYELKTYKRDPKSNLAPKDYKALHPLGKSPLVEMDGEMFAETAAVMEYILETRAPGKLAPAPGDPSRFRYLHWMHAVEGSLMPLLVMSLLFNRMDDRAPFLVKPIAKGLTNAVRKAYLQPSLDGQLAWLEAETGKSQWVAGDEFTAADIQLAFPLAAAAARGVLDARYPNVQAYVARLMDRPGYKAAAQKGGDPVPVR